MKRVQQPPFLPLLSLCLCLCGCTDVGEDSVSTRNDTVRTSLCVSGGISTLSSPRVADTAWEENDRIGIFMLEGGKELTDDYIAEDAFNRSYTCRASHNVFSPSAATDTIWFPRDAERKVDFIAYYPHSDRVNDTKTRPALSIDLSTAQTDYLYAARVTGHDRTTPQVAFTFHRLLSRVEVELIAGKGMEDIDLSGASVRISEIPVSATCLLADGSLKIDNGNRGALSLTIGSHTDAGYFSTLLLPTGTEGDTGRSLVITLPGKEGELVWNIPSDKVFHAGERTVYHITLTKKEVKPDPTPDPDPDPTPDPDPLVELAVTSHITGWASGNGDGEDGSAE